MTMTSKPQIYYDATCPICSNYIRLVKRKISESDVEYLPSGADARDFKYITESGTVFTGVSAIERMSSDFPSILDCMWMLPPSLKTVGLKAAYKVGSAVRRTIAKVKRGCNCGH